MNPAAPFSSEKYVFAIDFAETDADRPFPGSAEIAFANDKGKTINSDQVTLKVTAKTGFYSSGKSGHLYELIRKDDKDLSQAIFVQEDQQTVPVLRDSQGELTIFGVPL